MGHGCTGGGRSGSWPACAVPTGARRSADAEDAQLPLAARQRDGDLIADAAPEQRHGDGGFGRQPALAGRGVVGADDPPGLLDTVSVANGDSGAEADDAAGERRALLDDDRGGYLLAQPRDLRLEVRLVVLGVVVLAVL